MKAQANTATHIEIAIHYNQYEPTIKTKIMRYSHMKDEEMGNFQ